MKKVVMLGVLISMFMTSTAFADVLPAGIKYVPVCAYFDNTASVLNTMAVYGYETAPDGSMVSISSFIANECFTTSYKFNTYKVYGLTAAHAQDILQYDPYIPSDDQEAYPTNIQPEIGQKLISDTSNIEKYENVYHIVELNTTEGHLVIEPVKTKIYTTGVTEPEITEGVITPIVETPTLYEDAFTDITSTNSYYTAVKYLKDNGIVGGYPDGSYKPDTTINRAEFTKIVVGSIINSPDELTNCEAHYASQSSYMLTLFTDVEFAMVGGNIPDWYFDYVCIAKLNNIVSGYPDGTFQPAQEINFVEGAKIIVEALNLPTTASTPWYKSYVDVLDTNHAIPTSITTFAHKLTRGEMAEIMYRLKANVTNLPSNTYADLN
jgi:hypothetical protein